MPERVYTGPCPAVDVVLPDGSSVRCERDGQPQDFPGDVASQLDKQGNWKTPAAKTKTAHKGAKEE